MYVLKNSSAPCTWSMLCGTHGMPECQVSSCHSSNVTAKCSAFSKLLSTRALSSAEDDGDCRRWMVAVGSHAKSTCVAPSAKTKVSSMLMRRMSAKVASCEKGVSNLAL
eukprot:3287269-Amphidinium_carterae.1